MRGPGDILVVSCYELGRQPVAAAQALAGLERAGFAPAVQDLSVDRLAVAGLRAAKLVAISVPMHTALQLGVRVAARVREVNPAAHVAFFGLYAELNRAHLLARHGDSALPAEAVQPLVALAERLSQTSAVAPPLDQAPPLPDQAPRGPAPGGPRRDEALPSRGALPLLGRYARLEAGGERKLVAAVEASRGCKHLCKHCPIVPVYQGRFLAVPREIVLQDLAQQVAQGAGHASFGDPDFLNGPTHARRLARALHDRFPSLTWDATIKIEHLLAHRDLLPELAACGLLFITSAVESLNDRVLDALAKGHSAADVPLALSLVRAAGIELRPTLLPYTPWTRLEDLPALFDFAEDHDLEDAIDPVQFTLRLLLPPGSPLSEGAPPWLREFDEQGFTHRWVHEDPRVDALCRSSTAALRELGESAPPREAQARLRQLADDAVARPARAARARTPRRTVPRLSEPWFC